MFESLRCVRLGNRRIGKTIVNDWLAAMAINVVKSGSDPRDNHRWIGCRSGGNRLEASISYRLRMDHQKASYLLP